MPPPHQRTSIAATVSDAALISAAVTQTLTATTAGARLAKPAIRTAATTTRPTTNQPAIRAATAVATPSCAQPDGGMGSRPADQRALFGTQAANNLAEAGLLVRQFDGLDDMDHGKRWLPCPKDAWCGSLRDRWAATIINKDVNALYYGTDSVGGLILESDVVKPAAASLRMAASGRPQRFVGRLAATALPASLAARPFERSAMRSGIFPHAPSHHTS